MLRRTRKGLRLVVFWLIVLAAASYFINDQPAKPAPVKTLSPVCASAADPCVQLNGPDDKQIARFNDFRFQPNNCIEYRQTVSDKFQQYCGQYHLKWIGPNNSDQKKGFVI